MGTFDLYPCYKDSKVPCFGSIPNHWNVLALHYVSTLKSGSSITALEFKENGLYPVYGGNGLRGYFVDYTHDGEYVLIGRQGALCGNVNLGFGKFFASEHAIVVHPIKKFNVRWMSYLLGSMNLNQYSLAAAQPGLSAEVIGRLKIVFPEEGEQEAIVRFLDYKTGQIDALIAKKEALLAKLAEKRTALISHAVTKGLDPSAPMKDSGVAWLGDVPAHWKVLPLKHAIMFQRGHDLPAGDRIEGDIPLVSSSGISSCHDRAIAKGPGIVTGRYGTIGNFTYVQSDYWPLNTTLYSIETHGNNEKYLWFMLHVLSGLFILNSKKGAVPGIDRNDLHPVLTVMPARSEQDAIAEYLEKTTIAIDLHADLIRKTIEKLIEYRAALITNAVTGKIDVRQFALPITEQEAAHA